MTIIECQKCGKPIPFTGYSEPRTIRHLPILGKPCYLVIRPKKGVCQDSDKHPTTWQKLDWCDTKSCHTKAYEQHLMLALVNRTVADVAIKEAVGEKVVRGVIDRWISQETDWKSVKKLGLLGIDEIALRKGYQDYLTLVTARIEDQVRLIGVIEGREKAKVKAFLKSRPGRLKRTITGICCDKEPISNYFRKRETSGFVEGLNNKAKVTKRRCYGILSVKTFFQRLFLDTQGYDLFLGAQGMEAA